MMMNILKVDKDDARPAYQQIVEQIRDGITQGVLLPGERLPPGRDLAAALGVARGTITKAFVTLERDGLIELSQGRGAFVAHQPAAGVKGVLDRDQRARELVSACVDELMSLRFSGGEIEQMISAYAEDKEKEREPVIVAVMDCNPECLAIYEKQLLNNTAIQLVPILLDAIPDGPEGETRLAPYELLLTTTKHYQEVQEKQPSVRDRLIPVSVNLTLDTTARLARLGSMLKVGVVCESTRFFEIVSEHVTASGIVPDHIQAQYTQDMQKLPEVLAAIDVIVVPPGFSLLQYKEHAADIQRFTERGGLILPFEYQIEQGSLIHINDRIKAIYESR